MNTKAKRYIQIVLCVATVLVIGTSMLLNSPRVQRQMSIIIASELENRIGTRVELGSVHWLFPNDLVIDSLTIDDQEGEKLFAASRIAAKVEWKPLISKRQISIRNIRIFYPELNIYREDSEAETNYQFLVDAFAAKEKKVRKNRLNLRMTLDMTYYRPSNSPTDYVRNTSVSIICRPTYPLRFSQMTPSVS